MLRLFTACLLCLALLLQTLTAADAGEIDERVDVSSESDADKSPDDSDSSGDGESSAEEKKSEDDESDDDESDADEKKPETKSEKDEEGDGDAKSADDKADESESDKEKEKPEAHTVETKDLKIEATLDGVFVSREMEEVALRPETWSTFKVVEAVEHGASVRKGEILVKFDDTKFEESLADKSLAQRLSELEMMEAEEEFPRFEEAVELAWQDAKRERQEYLDEHKRFKEVMRPLSEKMARANLKDSKQSLENAREELEQLEKMYEADELTEETEEIVLKRQRHMVEYYELYVEYATVNHDYMLNVTLPRREEQLTTGLKRTELSFERAKMIKSLGLTKKRYEMEKLRETRARSVEQHAKLVADRSLMTLRAPVDGIVYYGRCVNGRWTDVSSLTNKLIPFGSVSANSVVMTIVQPRPLWVQSSVSEKNFPELSDGQKATVSPVADDKVELKATIENLSSVPGSSNKFPVELDVDMDEAPDWLMPGMTCKAKITTYEADDAVVVPENLVNSDDDNPKEKYVMLVVDGKDEPVRRDVKLGHKKDKEVEILSGLKEGDKIVKKEAEKKD